MTKKKKKKKSQILIPYFPENKSDLGIIRSKKKKSIVEKNHLIYIGV